MRRQRPNRRHSPNVTGTTKLGASWALSWRTSNTGLASCTELSAARFSAAAINDDHRDSRCARGRRQKRRRFAAAEIRFALIRPQSTWRQLPPMLIKMAIFSTLAEREIRRDPGGASDRFAGKEDRTAWSARLQKIEVSRRGSLGRSMRILRQATCSLIKRRADRRPGGFVSKSNPGGTKDRVRGPSLPPEVPLLSPVACKPQDLWAYLFACCLPNFERRRRPAGRLDGTISTFSTKIFRSQARRNYRTCGEEARAVADTERWLWTETSFPRVRASGMGTSSSGRHERSFDPNPHGNLVGDPAKEKVRRGLPELFSFSARNWRIAAHGETSPIH